MGHASKALLSIVTIAAFAVSMIASAQVYSGNKRSNAVCGEYTPSTIDINFNCQLVANGTAPADIEVSMTNKSGCEVVTRGDIKIVGTQGHVYSNTKLGSKPGSFYGFNDKYTPFGSMLAPNTQEYPASCELNNIEVCSNTPPKGFPSTTRFNGFHNGKCSKFATIGPIQLPAVALPAKSASEYRSCAVVSQAILDAGTFVQVANSCDYEINIVAVSVAHRTVNMRGANDRRGGGIGWNSNTMGDAFLYVCPRPLIAADNNGYLPTAPNQDIFCKGKAAPSNNGRVEY